MLSNWEPFSPARLQEKTLRLHEETVGISKKSSSENLGLGGKRQSFVSSKTDIIKETN
jgi:hypothetical protein